MKRLTILILMCISLTGSFGQQKPDTTAKAKASNCYPSEITIKLPDKINIEDTSEKKENQSSNMPWVAALIIGILSAFINILVADRLKKSNERNIDRQLNNAKELALAEFGATLGTKNRQDWIDRLRDSLSEFISLSAMINVEMSSAETNNDKVKGLFQQMNYNKAKIAMLINIDKPEQKEVIDQVYKMVSISFKSKEDYDASEFKKIEDDLLIASRKLFGIHWKIIKESFNSKK